MTAGGDDERDSHAGPEDPLNVALLDPLHLADSKASDGLVTAAVTL